MIRDEVIYYLELKSDNIFRKIEKKDYMYYIKSSIDYAREMHRKYYCIDIKKVLKDNKVAVNYIHNKNKINTEYMMSSEIIYFDNKKEINVYIDLLKEKQKILLNKKIYIDLAGLIDICIAHEFFHFLEIKYELYTYKSLKKVSNLFYKCYVKTCSEIAAIEFSKLYCNMRINPKYIDYLFLIENSFIGNDYFEEADYELHRL